MNKLLFTFLLLSFVCMSSILHVKSSRPNCAQTLQTNNAGTSDSFGRTTLQDDSSFLHGNTLKVSMEMMLADVFAKKAMKALAPSVFNGVLGPTNEDIPQVTFTSTSNAKCQSCQVDCLKHWEGLGDKKLFTSCANRYFYYGCDRSCFYSHTASDKDVATMIGICYVRNQCKFNSAVILPYIKKYKLKTMDKIIKSIGSYPQNTRAE